MRATESGFEGFDLDGLGRDRQRLDFAQCQWVRAFLTDSSHYLGLSVAGGEGQPQERRAGAALAFQEVRSSDDLRGC